MKHFSRVIGLAVLFTILLAGALGPALAQSQNPINNPVQVLVPEVVSVRPHDTGAYTQGLLWYNGYLYESTGENGQSTLRKVDPQTGEVLQSISLPEEYFAEGLERVGDKLIQLTWKSQVAFVYNLDTFEQTGTYQYQGEGWGLCNDGRFLYMSDGSPFIQLRDKDTFDLLFSGLVTYQGGYVNEINELECVGDYVYANVWQTDYIIQIDRMNGVVVAVIDCGSLLTDEERAKLNDPDAVLNGIAYDPETDTFLITGKYWPKMFEVKFVPRGQ
jgi:glutamine cyclotransferase